MEGRHIPSALLFFVKYPSIIKGCGLSLSSCQEHITSASVAEYHSSDQLGFKMLLSSSEPPSPPPSETSPPPQTSPLLEDQQGN